ncbi:ABC transporter ATP-binding protein [Clostridiales bacterium COT073_COT-073]|nr:ABC transporter ATP-binding protein [Clostridiales bacterium COT073_COT-073]
MSVGITIKNALKKFNENVIIPNLSLKVRDGEFFTLLGPSGCGKTTLLRMIAGFNSIEGGDFYFNDKRVNDLEPAKRNIGMVFQNYAIFPHYTVRKNVEFGLRNRNINSQEIKDKTDRFLKLMKIDQLADRKPDRMSGGQQQRVALARALVIEPDVLLMDEPLSNLDAKLRVEMRSTIRSIQKQVGITTVYVTHDQEEAMAISDRIGVMKEGVLQQISDPKSIYQRPINQFVATFIGRSNILEGEVQVESGQAYLVVGNKGRIPINTIEQKNMENQKVIVSARPEEILLCKDDTGILQGIVKECIFLGLNTHYVVELETGDLVEMTQESTIEDILSNGTKVSVTFNAEKINLFGKKDGINIMQGVCNDICIS